MTTAPRQFRVYDGERLVIEVRDEPGVLVSISAPPPRPGTEPPTHPFLSASFYAAELEGAIAEILAQANSTREFLARLAERGYRVAEDPL